MEKWHGKKNEIIRLPQNVITVDTLVKHEGRFILVWGQRLSVHSAKDGEMHWVSTGFNPKQKKNWVVVGSQVVVGDIAIVPYGRGTHMKGIRMGGKGDVTESHLLWIGPVVFCSSPAVAKGKPYFKRSRRSSLRLIRKQGIVIGKMLSTCKKVITDLPPSLG